MFYFVMTFVAQPEQLPEQVRDRKFAVVFLLLHCLALKSVVFGKRGSRQSTGTRRSRFRTSSKEGMGITKEGGWLKRRVWLGVGWLVDEGGWQNRGWLMRGGQLMMGVC